MEIKEKKKKKCFGRQTDLKMGRGNNIEMGLRKCVIVGSFFNLCLVSVAVSLIVKTFT